MLKAAQPEEIEAAIACILKDTHGETTIRLGFIQNWRHEATATRRGSIQAFELVNGTAKRDLPGMM